MSYFYLTGTGARGVATRCGTKNSGVRTAVQSYQGSCISRLHYCEGKNILTIETSKYSSTYGDRKFSGTIEEFNELMDLIKLVGGTERAKEILKRSL